MDLLQNKIQIIKRSISTTLLLTVGLVSYNIFFWNEMNIQQGLVSIGLCLASFFWIKSQSKRLTELESLKYAGIK
jgi:hypothetical protein